MFSTPNTFPNACLYLLFCLFLAVFSLCRRQPATTFQLQRGDPVVNMRSVNVVLQEQNDYREVGNFRRH